MLVHPALDHDILFTTRTVRSFIHLRRTVGGMALWTVPCVCKMEWRACRVVINRLMLRLTCTASRLRSSVCDTKAKAEIALWFINGQIRWRPVNNRTRQYCVHWYRPASTTGDKLHTASNVIVAEDGDYSTGVEKKSPVPHTMNGAPVV